MKLPKGFGNMGSLMRQAQEAMEQAKRLEEELKLMEVESESNGVQVRFNGVGDLLSIKISPELVTREDIESLEDCILLAVRDGYQKSVDLRAEKIRAITSGLGLGM